MSKRSTWSWHYLVVLLLALALLLSPALALAAEDEAAPAATSLPFTDDLSYAKYLIRNYALYPLNDQVLKSSDVEGMIKELHKTDPWAQYFPADQFSSYWNMVEGDFIGIGVYVRIENDQLLVLGTIAGTPADRGGMKNGDIIVSVDKLSAPTATPQQLLDALTGEENSMVTVKYQRDGRVTELLMNRKRIITPSIQYWMLEDGVGYVAIEQFTAHTGDELSDGIKSLKAEGMKALLVDLRYCPGGEIDSAIDVCALLCGEGPMLFYVDNIGWWDFAAVNDAPPLDLPLAVMINGDTASSAELVAANVQDTGAGVLVGVSSYGKGVVQHVVPLPSGAGFSFTTDKFMTNRYQDIDAAGGVLPDIYVEDEEAQQERAVAWLKEQLAQPTFLKFYVGLAGYSAGGTWQSDAAGALLIDGNAYLPLELTLSQMGWQRVERNGELYFERNNQRMLVDKLSARLILTSGSDQLLEQNGQLYIRAAALRMFGCKVTWDAGERSVRIDF